jgi:predicted nucleic acid-binding protein
MPRSSGAKLFLDTTVIVSAVTKRNVASYNLLLNYEGELYINEYVLKECVRVLKELGYSDELVSRALEYVKTRCEVLPAPNKREFVKIAISDKSDKPIVCSAMKKGCVLVIDDEETYIDAKKYVETKHSDEITQELL